MKRKLLLAAGCGAALIFAGPAVPGVLLAQEEGASEVEGGKAAVPQEGAQFAEEAASAMAAELSLVRMVPERAGDDQLSDAVMDYAATVQVDHGKTLEDLRAIAAQLSLDLDASRAPDLEQVEDRLSALSGKRFERAFVEQMIVRHEDAVRRYEEQAVHGENPLLREFASEMQDVQRDHLDKARLLERQLGETETAGAADRRPGTQPQNPLQQMPASDLIGMPVLNRAGERVGEIEDIVIGKDDQIRQVVVEVGGFLGIGDKSVAVPIDELQLNREQTILMSRASAEELERRPAYSAPRAE